MELAGEERDAMPLTKIVLLLVIIAVCATDFQIRLRMEKSAALGR
jgi:hypothetical protein